MNTYRFWTSMACAFVATAAVVSAQSGGAMSKGMSDGKADKMQSMDKSYTGCIEKDAKSGAYSLSHAVAADSMMKDGMMKKDGMAMDKGKDAMPMDMWMAVTSKDVDLSKHVGHKVTIMGAGAMPMGMDKEMGKTSSAQTMSKDKPMAKGMDASSFTVKSLTMVSSSCQ